MRFGSFHDLVKAIGVAANRLERQQAIKNFLEDNHVKFNLLKIEEEAEALTELVVAIEKLSVQSQK